MGYMPASFLLHTCCAPCGIAVIDELRNVYDLTVFFYNPNIYPEAEYLKRKVEVIKLCTEWSVPMIDADYEQGVWDAAVAGLENEPECGERCRVCFGVRLEKAAAYAASHNFDRWCTTISMGRKKSAAIINPIGIALGKKYGVPFHDVDWKKEGRIEKGRRMTVERSIYRQTYCGCRYSIPTQSPGE
jgi:epoxyqueuosine reductase